MQSPTSLNSFSDYSTPLRFLDDDSRWAAVRDRNPEADQAFVYCVKTTKIYCRPICKARLARRSNVEFFTFGSEAVKAGYRACKRCKPELATSMPEEDAVRKIMAFIAMPTDPDAPRPNLDTMAKSIGLSKWHFHRVFKKVVGMTPTEYIKTIQPGSSSISESSLSPNTLSDTTLITFNCPTPLSLENTSPESGWDSFDFLAEPLPELDLVQAVQTPKYVSPSVTVFNYTYFRSDASSIQSVLNSLTIFYTIRLTSFGPLLVAFQNDRVCMLNQMANEINLFTALENKFPPSIYMHQDISMDPNNPLQLHVESILQLLDKPA
jgi:methylphosphotriester-DNA--protein-cysteine methyltransferase